VIIERGIRESVKNSICNFKKNRLKISDLLGISGLKSAGDPSAPQKFVFIERCIRESVKNSICNFKNKRLKISDLVGISGL